MLSHIRTLNCKLNDIAFPVKATRYTHRFRELTCALSTQAKWVLHLGSGPVNLELLVGSEPAAPHVVALDISQNALRHNSGKFRVCGDGGVLPLPSNSIDLVVAEHVFEHFPAPKICLEECFRVMKHGGKLVVSGPYGWSYVALAARLTPLAVHDWVRRLQGYPRNGRVQSFPTFYRFNSPRVVHQLAARVGFRVVSDEKFVGEPCYTTSLPFIHLAFIAYHFGMEKFGSHWGSHMTSVVVLEKPARFES
jgi:SAM-dependent methyltransferase